MTASGPARKSMTADAARGPRSRLVLLVILTLSTLLFAGFVALGHWQWQRRAWKLDLIAHVDSRIRAAAVAAPGRELWPRISSNDEYLRVQLDGHFLAGQQSLVAASTERGSGYWVMTPLRTNDGSTILVNRGFVPAASCKLDRPCVPPLGEVTVTGLLRISQTYAFLRSNDPVHARWYTRDVQAIAAAHGLSDVAPYFVDADAIPRPGDVGENAWPQGGMTTVAFANNHLVYMLTWYLLALLVAVGTTKLFIAEHRLRSNA